MKVIQFNGRVVESSCWKTANRIPCINYNDLIFTVPP